MNGWKNGQTDERMPISQRVKAKTGNNVSDCNVNNAQSVYVCNFSRVETAWTVF